jgi:hypothetical protein
MKREYYEVEKIANDAMTRREIKKTAFLWMMKMMQKDTRYYTNGTSVCVSVRCERYIFTVIKELHSRKISNSQETDFIFVLLPYRIKKQQKTSSENGTGAWKKQQQLFHPIFKGSWHDHGLLGNCGNQ